MAKNGAATAAKKKTCIAVSQKLIKAVESGEEFDKLSPPIVVIRPDGTEEHGSEVEIQGKARLVFREKEPLITSYCQHRAWIETTAKVDIVA